MNYFSLNILFLRKSKGLNQSQLADNLGFTRGQVAAWENKKSKPRVDDLIRVCNYFSVSIDDMLTKDLSNLGLIKNSGVEPQSDSIGKMYTMLEKYVLALENAIKKECPNLAKKLRL